MIKDPSAILDMLPVGMLGSRRENGIFSWKYLRSESEWQIAETMVRTYEGRILLRAKSIEEFAEYSRSLHGPAPKGATWFVVVPDRERIWKARRAEAKARMTNINDLSTNEDEELFSDALFDDRIIEFPGFAFHSFEDAKAWLLSHPSEEVARIYRGAGIFSDHIRTIGERQPVEDGNKFGEFSGEYRIDQLERCIPEEEKWVADGCNQTDMALDSGRRVIPLADGYRISCEKGLTGTFFVLQKPNPKRRHRIVIPKERKKVMFTIENLAHFGEYLFGLFNKNFMGAEMGDSSGEIYIESLWTFGGTLRWYASCQKTDAIKICCRAMVLLQNLKYVDICYSRCYRRHVSKTSGEEWHEHNSKLLEYLEWFVGEKDRLEREAKTDQSIRKFKDLVFNLHRDVLKVKKAEEKRRKRNEKAIQSKKLAEFSAQDKGSGDVSVPEAVNAA